MTKKELEKCKAKEIDDKANESPRIIGFGFGKIAPNPDSILQPYQIRFVKEYRELKDRYCKLHNMLIKYEAGTLGFRPTCSLELLTRQAKVMGEYIKVLEIRAEIEKVDLNTPIIL